VGSFGPRKSSAGHVGLIAVLVIVLVILIIAAIVYYAGRLNPVKVTGVNWTVKYNGATSDYFGPSPQSICSSCPIEKGHGAQFSYTITLESSATSLTHSIDNVTVESPFTLVSVSPSLPISVSPGGSATVALTIKAPSQDGSYVLSGTINTT